MGFLHPGGFLHGSKNGFQFPGVDHFKQTVLRCIPGLKQKAEQMGLLNGKTDIVQPYGEHEIFRLRVSFHQIAGMVPVCFFIDHSFQFLNRCKMVHHRLRGTVQLF